MKIAVIVVLALVASASAHSWMEPPTRRSTSTNAQQIQGAPCADTPSLIKSKTTKVVAGQQLVVEWSNQHDNMDVRLSMVANPTARSPTAEEFNDPANILIDNFVDNTNPADHHHHHPGWLRAGSVHAAVEVGQLLLLLRHCGPRQHQLRAGRRLLRPQRRVLVG